MSQFWPNVTKLGNNNSVHVGILTYFIRSSNSTHWWSRWKIIYTCSRWLQLGSFLMKNAPLAYKLNLFQSWNFSRCHVHVGTIKIHCDRDMWVFSVLFGSWNIQHTANDHGLMLLRTIYMKKCWTFCIYPKIFWVCLWCVTSVFEIDETNFQELPRVRCSYVFSVVPLKGQKYLQHPTNMHCASWSIFCLLRNTFTFTISA